MGGTPTPLLTGCGPVMVDGGVNRVAAGAVGAEVGSVALFGPYLCVLSGVLRCDLVTLVCDVVLARRSVPFFSRLFRPFVVLCRGLRRLRGNVCAPVLYPRARASFFDCLSSVHVGVHDR